MSVELVGLSGVQARVASIQSQLDALSGASPAPPPATTTNGRTFEQALSQASTPAANTASAGWPVTTTSTPPTSPAQPSALGTAGADTLIAAAKKYLGVPYKWGGTDPAVGLDCSGLVQRAYGDVGIKLPRVAADQARAGTPVESIAAAKPGDLVAFGDPVDHIGIYVGDNQMLVAPRTGDVVKIQKLYRTPTAIRRVLPDLPTQPSLPTLPSLPTAVGQGTVGTSATAGIGAGTAALAQAPAAHQSLFLNAQAKYGVSAALLAAVAKQESNFNERAVSPAGARGLMQIMPGTARELGVDPTNPSQAVDGAARLLRDHLRTFGSTELALAAYNAGPGAVSKYGGVPPYAETQNYVRRIMSSLGVSAP
ncbi:MAG: transglycosylase SLT domain-containing protein [Austwickia sp.]|nr:transglycosylase SLT domain-containing protein [Austwickia sp.]MBK8436450.1 transglycosylase SLT domain-containing protein [Austwickia sp.]MBK9102126.1 transglycosylase SLT domain-containing protein [Austwickia sp.]